MGKAVSKEVVTINQNGQQEIEVKINQFGVMLIIIMGILVTGAVCVVTNHCNQRVRNWLRKQVNVAVTTPPQVPSVVCTHMQQNQAASATGSYA